MLDKIKNNMGVKSKIIKNFLGNTKETKIQLIIFNKVDYKNQQDIIFYFLKKILHLRHALEFKKF